MSSLDIEREYHAIRAWVEGQMVFIELSDGRQIGFPAARFRRLREATAAQLAEVAMRYPEGKFIMGHLAYADYWNDVESACQAAPNIWLETSAHLASVIRLWTGQAGAHRVMYGSDSPHNDMPVEIEKITRYITDDATKAMIFAGTLERLLEAD